MNRTVQYLLAIVFCAVMTPSLSSSAQSNNGRPRHNRDAEPDSGRSADAREEKWERDPIVFSARDRVVIREYYRDRTSNLFPALAKRESNLPRVQRKHLQRNGTLSPELQKRFEPLAGDIERRLRVLYSGYSRGMIGQDLVIVEDSTQRIMDIIRDVTDRR
jgi:hypothetical protein